MGKGLGYFTNYPKHVLIILANEFCERFSYYGMKAFLVLYFTEALNFGDSTAVAIYHSFVVLCYFTPLIGAMIADGWLGKFKTILYVSIIYAIGLILMTITAIPFNDTYNVWAPFIGLTLIAFGTGGIKPNVSSFGGDQFSPDQQRQKTSFFSLFYMAINIGSLLSTVITPLIRGYVYCFDDNCYTLAFGIPAALMVVSEVIFLIGSKWYTKIPPGESILRRMFGCVGTAIKRKCGCCSSKNQIEIRDTENKIETKKHWLDYAAPDYDKQFISDVKDVFRVSWLFIPLPVFWSLFDQQGSRWTLQATQMDGDLGGFVFLPDMIQVLNPLIVVALVPIFESLLYPCFDKLRIPNRPLQRMTAGMTFAATAFLLAGLLQIAIDKDLPPKLKTDESRYQIVNPSPCDVNVTTLDGFFNIKSLSNHKYLTTKSGENNFTVSWGNECNATSTSRFTFTFDFKEKTTYQLLTDSMNFQMNSFIQEKIVPTPKSKSTVRFYNGLGKDINITMSTVKDQEKTPRDLGEVSSHNMSGFEEIILAKYNVEITVLDEPGSPKKVSTEIYSQNGAVYTMLLTESSPLSKEPFVMSQLLEIEPWSQSIFLQVPQYFIITVGEVLFSVTGLSFAYTQAAPSMKSIMTSIWLLTVAIGNVVVVIIAETGSAMGQMAEFFLFSGLMFATTVVFAIMASFYIYVERNDWGVEEVEIKEGGELNEGIEITEKPPEYEEKKFNEEKKINEEDYDEHM